MHDETERSRKELKIEFEVDGEVWHRVEALADAGPDDRVFVARTNDDGTTTVVFGDGKHGARLPSGTDEIDVIYRPAKRYTAVLMQQGRVILDSDWNEKAEPGNRFFGLYRGIVRGNSDPLNLMRLRVQVPEALGEQEEWALPCVPVGATSVPEVGSNVWVAFESGEPSQPVWVGTFWS